MFENVAGPRANERSVFGGEDMSIEVVSRLSAPPPPAAPPSAPPKHRVMSASAPERTPTPLAITRIGDWVVDKTLGAGSTAKVKLARNRRTGEVCAVKIVARSPQAMGAARAGRKSRESTASRERRVFREAALLNLLADERIVALRDFVVTADHFCMLFEYVDGVQLLDYIVSHGRLGERQARAFFRQAVRAVDYCHAHGVVHRDLKIENILVDAAGRIKLLDFGLSNFWAPDGLLTTYCGSLYFAAPELLHGRPYVGPEVDVWSLGVILYVLVVGRVPFDDRSIPVLHEKIKRARVAIPDTVSAPCRDLILRMLCREPEKRASLADVACHAWTNDGHRSVPQYVSAPRDPPDAIDERAVSLLVHSFVPEVIPAEEDIRAVLHTATRDWAAVHRHPVVLQYFLACDRIAALEAEGRGSGWWAPDAQEASVSVAACERSRSMSAVPRDGAIGPAQGFTTQPASPRQTEALSPPPRAARRASAAPAIAPSGRAPPARNVPPIPEDSAVDPPSSARRHSVSVPASPKHAMARHASLQAPAGRPADGSRAQDDYLGIRTVFFKGLFSVHTTSGRPAMAIRNEVQHALMRAGVRFEDRRSFFVCEARTRGPADTPPDTSRSEWSAPGDARPVRFEVHIVRLALLGGMYGLQFKRIAGDVPRYKAMCAQLLSSVRL